MNRSSGIETVSRSATNGTAALASSLPENRLQAGRIDLQDMQHCTPINLSHHIRALKTTRNLRYSSMPLLHKLTTRTHFADRSFHFIPPSVRYIVDSS